MMVETVVDAMSTYYTVACWKIAIALIPIIVTQIAHKQQHQFQLQQDLLFLDPLVQQQVNLLQVAMQDGLLMDIVMVSITTWTATMMVETVVDVMSAHNTVALHATALIPMEAGVEQLAHKQQHQFQLQQALLFLDPLN